MSTIAPKSQIARAVVDTANKFASSSNDTKDQKAGGGDKAKAAPSQTALEQHISFFENLAKPGTVNAKNTRGGLEALGLTGASKAFGGHALTVAFAVPQAGDKGVMAKLKAAASGELQIDRIDEGVRGVNEKTGERSDSGVYDDKGNINAEAFMTMWKDFAGDKGYLNDSDVVALVENKVVNALEFGLLMELAGQINTDGERVLTPETMISFYDGALFDELAKAREDGVLLVPTGVQQHDGTKEIAKSLASMALQNGGAAAGEGAKSIYGAKMTIDVDASLKYQQKDKSLGPTIKLAGGTALKGLDSDLAQSIGTSLAGTFKAMCPAGKG